MHMLQAHWNCLKKELKNQLALKHERETVNKRQNEFFNRLLFCYTLGGLCNLCLDKINKDYILEADGVAAVINCLSCSNEETVMSAVTTLMYLTTPQSRQQITALPVVECMLRFSLSANRRLSNLATIFLDDYCSPLQVEEARNRTKHTALGIPLPKN